MFFTEQIKMEYVIPDINRQNFRTLSVTFFIFIQQVATETDVDKQVEVEIKIMVKVAIDTNETDDAMGRTRKGLKDCLDMVQVHFKKHLMV